MIQGCMTWKGVEYVTKIDGRMDSDFDLQILKDKLLNLLEHYGLNPSDLIFQQDNDPKHTSKKVKVMAGKAGSGLQNYGVACTVS